MPVLKLKGIGGSSYATYLTISGGPYKPGDPPPAGYCDWHEWSDVQHKAGLRQKACALCGKWKYPQEIARTMTRSTVTYRTKRDLMEERNPIHRTEKVPVCNDCESRSRLNESCEKSSSNHKDTWGAIRRFCLLCVNAW